MLIDQLSQWNAITRQLWKKLLRLFPFHFSYTANWFLLFFNSKIKRPQMGFEKKRRRNEMREEKNHNRFHKIKLLIEIFLHVLIGFPVHHTIQCSVPNEFCNGCIWNNNKKKTSFKKQNFFSLILSRSFVAQFSHSIREAIPWAIFIVHVSELFW